MKSSSLSVRPARPGSAADVDIVRKILIESSRASGGKVLCPSREQLEERIKKYVVYIGSIGDENKEACMCLSCYVLSDVNSARSLIFGEHLNSFPFVHPRDFPPAFEPISMSWISKRSGHEPIRNTPEVMNLWHSLFERVLAGEAAWAYFGSLAKRESFKNRRSLVTNEFLPICCERIAVQWKQCLQKMQKAHGNHHESGDSALSPILVSAFGIDARHSLSLVDAFEKIIFRSAFIASSCNRGLCVRHHGIIPGTKKPSTISFVFVGDLLESVYNAETVSSPVQTVGGDAVVHGEIEEHSVYPIVSDQEAAFISKCFAKDLQSISIDEPAGRLIIADGSEEAKRDRHLLTPSLGHSGLTGSPVAVLEPRSVRQVQACVKSAVKTNTSLYPISIGNNWGYGGHLSSNPSSYLLRLSEMNRIRALDLDMGLAMVEVGVTQRILDNALKGTEWQCNLNSSCANSSIVGNILDRGIGLSGSTVDDLISVEFVDGLGEMHRMGGNAHRQWEESTAKLDSCAPAGPDTLGLVLQSSGVVVTAAVVALHPRPSETRLVSCGVGADDLPRVIGILSRLMRSHHITNVVKVFNEAAMDTYAVDELSQRRRSQAPSTMTLMLIVSGNSIADVEHKLDTIVSALSKDDLVSQPTIISPENASHLPAGVQEFVFEGSPSCAFHANLALRQPSITGESAGANAAQSSYCQVEVGSSRYGWLLFRSSFPTRSSTVAEAQRLVIEGISANNDIASTGDVRVSLTFNVMDFRTVEMLMSFRWPIQQSHIFEGITRTLVQELESRFGDAAMFSNRLDIEQQHCPELVYGKSAHAQSHLNLLKTIKQSLDPYNVISPGRYALGLM